MALWQIILLALAGGLIGAIALEAFLKRNNPKRTFAQKIADDIGLGHEDELDKPELGMEATDMNVVLLSERANKSASSFAARDSGFWIRQTRRNTKKTNPPVNGQGDKND